MKWVHHTIIMSAMLALFIWISWTPPSQQQGVYFPWQTRKLESGESCTFSLCLGKSTLKEVLALSPEASVSIFYHPEGSLQLEAFIADFKTGPLIANLAIELDAPQTLLKQAYEDYEVHRKPTSQKGFQVKIDATNTPQLQNSATVTSLNYSPKAKLNDAILTEKFGKPAQIIPENERISHWLYPNKGLAIAVNTDGHDLFQYVSPEQFSLLRDKIQASAPKTP